MKTRKELIEARALALASMKAASTADDFNQVVYDKAKKDVDSISAQIEAFDLETKLANEVDPVLAPEGSKKKVPTSAVTALMAYARTGVIDAQNSVTIGGASNGAVLIPQEYASSIMTELAKETAMRKFATVVTTNGTYNMPIGGATPSFGWVDEGGAYPRPDLTFTNKSLEAFKAGGIILVAEELLEDESFNLASHLSEKITEGLSLAEGEAFISGDGVKKPTGIINDITASLTATASALDTITLADVEDIYLSIPAKARKKGSWMISDKFYKAIFRMKDSTGNYILREGANGEPGVVFNRPFEIDDTMEGGAGEPLAVFGKLNDYVIGDRGEMAIQRLNEKFADEGFVGFKVYKRTDGKLSSTKNVAQFKNAAS